MINSTVKLSELELDELTFKCRRAARVALGLAWRCEQAEYRGWVDVAFIDKMAALMNEYEDARDKAFGRYEDANLWSAANAVAAELTKWLEKERDGAMRDGEGSWPERWAGLATQISEGLKKFGFDDLKYSTEAIEAHLGSEHTFRGLNKGPLNSELIRALRGPSETAHAIMGLVIGKSHTSMRKAASVMESFDHDPQTRTETDDLVAWEVELQAYARRLRVWI